jgi:transcriptional regulator with XRE-family HTH domain
LTQILLSHSELSCMAEIETEFGKWLNMSRKQRGLTMRELGDVSDLTHVSISGYENKGTTPKRATVERLAKTLFIGSSDDTDAFTRFLNEGLRAAGFATEDPTQDDPDLAVIVEMFEEMPLAGRQMLRRQAEDLRNLLSEANNANTNFGKRAE